MATPNQDEDRNKHIVFLNAEPRGNQATSNYENIVFVNQFEERKTKNYTC